METFLQSATRDNRKAIKFLIQIHEVIKIVHCPVRNCDKRQLASNFPLGSNYKFVYFIKKAINSLNFFFCITFLYAMKKICWQLSLAGRKNS